MSGSETARLIQSMTASSRRRLPAAATSAPAATAQPKLDGDSLAHWIGTPDPGRCQTDRRQTSLHADSTTHPDYTTPASHQEVRLGGGPEEAPA